MNFIDTQLDRIEHTARTLGELVSLSRHDRWTRERLEAHQAERLETLVSHAIAHSPFYRERYRAAGVGPGTPLSALPTLDKTTLMAHFDAIVTDRRLRLSRLETHLDELDGDARLLGEYRVMSTGGSSGQLGIFAWNAREWATSLASTLRANRFLDLRLLRARRVRTASITASSAQHLSARYAMTTTRFGVTRSLYLDARAPLEALIEALAEFQPDILSSYPSIAAMLAAAQLDGRLDISPEAVVTTGEVLTDVRAQRIRDAWGDCLFNAYATTETGFCGIECSEHRGVHLLEDETIFEVVDADNRPVPPGVEGDKVLVTSLFSRTVPLIRYELSDLLTLSALPCPCGRPFQLVRSIGGRREDILRLRAPDQRIVELHPSAVTEPIERTPGVRQFQVVHTPESLDIAVVAESGADTTALPAMLERIVAREIAGHGIEATTVRVRMVPLIERSGIASKARVIARSSLDSEAEAAPGA